MRTTHRILSAASLLSVIAVVGGWGFSTGSARADEVTVTIGSGSTATILTCAPPPPHGSQRIHGHGTVIAPTVIAPPPASSAAPATSVAPAASSSAPTPVASAATNLLTSNLPPEVAGLAAVGGQELTDRLAKQLGGKKGAELLLRFAYAFQDPQSPVRFAPAPGANNFATQPGGIYEGSEAPFRGGALTSLGVGYRFTEGVSFGLGGTFTQFLTSLTTGEGSSNLGRTALGIAPYIRAYARVGKSFEAWGSAGAGYTSDATTFDRITAAGGTTAQGKWELDYQAISFNAGVGIDWQPLSWLFLGPSVTYVGNIALKGCLKIDSPNLQKSWCSDDQISVTRAFSYQVFSAGLSVRAAVF